MMRRLFMATLALPILAGCGSRMPPAGEWFDKHNDGVSKPMDAPYGVWNVATEQAAPASYEEAAAELEALGYLAGSTAAPEDSGVRRYDRERAYDGLNFYTSGHTPGAYLTDMEGNVLHFWRRELKDVFPDAPVHENSPKIGYWRRAYLYPNGDVLAIFEGIGIIKLDRDSNVLWENQNGAHHDLEVLEDGRILVLTREVRQVDAISERLPTLVDAITMMSADGENLWSIDLLEAAQDSGDVGAEIWKRMSPQGDVMHTNSIERLDGRLAQAGPAFAEGNYLVSMLYPDIVAIVDAESERFVWSARGTWRRQHHPTILEDGSMLIFDNRAYNDRSRVLAFDPATGEERVLFEGTNEEPFYTYSCGAAEVLPNGNVLATESDGGRALEIANGDVVWEFVNPHRAGDKGQYIATLFELLRFDKDYATFL